MYRCQSCGIVAPARTPAYVLTTSTTQWIFPMRRYAQTEPPDQRRGRPKPQRKRRHLVTDPGGYGVQIRAEIRVCPTCFAAAARRREGSHLEG